MNHSQPPRRYSILHRHAYKILSVVLVLGFLNAWWPFEKMLEQFSEYCEQLWSDYQLNQRRLLREQQAEESKRNRTPQAELVDAFLLMCHSNEKELVERLTSFAVTRANGELVRHNETTKDFRIDFGIQLSMSWQNTWRDAGVEYPTTHTSEYELQLHSDETDEFTSERYLRDILFRTKQHDTSWDLISNNSSIEYSIDFEQQPPAETIQYSCFNNSPNLPVQISFTSKQTSLNLTFGDTNETQDKTHHFTIVIRADTKRSYFIDLQSEPAEVVIQRFLSEALKIIEANISDGKFFKKHYLNENEPQSYFNQEDEHYIEQLKASDELTPLQKDIQRKLESFQVDLKESNQGISHFIPDLFQHIQRERSEFLQLTPSSE
jgi:hypothetical protein